MLRKYKIRTNEIEKLNRKQSLGSNSIENIDSIVYNL